MARQVLGMASDLGLQPRHVFGLAHAHAEHGAIDCTCVIHCSRCAQPQHMFGLAHAAP